MITKITTDHDQITFKEILYYFMQEIAGSPVHFTKNYRIICAPYFEPS